MRILDLTIPLGPNTPIYSESDGYRDPPFVAQKWAVHSQHGYSVHRLELGTHTGTHLDAPIHFCVGGRTVDQVPPAGLVGTAVVIDVRALPRVGAAALQPYFEAVTDGGLPLFLAPESGVLLSAGAVSAVVDWRPRLILYAGQFLDETERYYHNRVWLGADIPLVTDLDMSTAVQVQDGDLLVVAPLPLSGLDGSPCRVFALQQESAPGDISSANKRLS